SDVADGQLPTSFLKVTRNELESIANFLYKSGEENVYTDLPMFRKTSYESPEINLNVVMLILPEICTSYSKLCSGKKNYTPELDKVAKKDLVYTRCYAGGDNLDSVLLTSLCSFPDQAGKSLTRQVQAQQQIPSLASILNKRGYSTLFFSNATQDRTQERFLHNTGFDYTYNRSDFVDHKKYSNGNIDLEDYYNSVVSRLNDESGTPFLAVINTAPVQIDATDYSGSDNEQKTARITSYIDKQLKALLNTVRGKNWHSSTLYIITSTPASGISKAEISTQVPLIFYASALAVSGRKEKEAVSQLDIAPTVLSIMNMDSENSFFGKDIYASSDRERIIAVALSDRHLVIAGKQRLEIYPNGSVDDFSASGTRVAPDATTSQWVKRSVTLLRTAGYLFKNNKIAR
ncbi:MAG: sulfatase-like hydrolase/transferase, partial [Candidatus Cloacimonetes bacterium]|nr:sulfatase-like hydrolase/transferase [Candidatus Cloacimonadota bacterium]